MKSAICTIFEGHYHNGVVALSNSLYKTGFRGTIYVGYRGSLPDWVLEGKKVAIGKWNEAIVLNPNIGTQIIFLPIVTNYNLANYKPDFMLELWEGPAKDEDAMFYFDSDIIVNSSWTCFEEWIQCGVAVCEDVNSPLQEFHPRRQGWKKYYKNHNIDLKFKNQIYVNAGFIGLLKKDISFLRLWIKVQEIMGPIIGGLENSIFSNQTYNSTVLKLEGFQVFDKPDQDALNAAIEAYNDNISYIGKEGMGFIHGEAIMFHALGSPKPWKTNHFLRFFNGRTPRKVDVAYWENCKGPIIAHSVFEIKKNNLVIKISKFLGRFYKV